MRTIMYVSNNSRDYDYEPINIGKLDKKAYVKMHKAAARKEDIKEGRNTQSFRRVHKNKKAYDRKSIKRQGYE